MPEATSNACPLPTQSGRFNDSSVAGTVPNAPVPRCWGHEPTCNCRAPSPYPRRRRSCSSPDPSPPSAHRSRQALGSYLNAVQARVGLRQFALAESRHDPWLLRHKPGECDLGGRCSPALCLGLQQHHESEVAGQVLWRKPGFDLANVAVGEARVLVDCPGQEAYPELRAVQEGGSVGTCKCFTANFLPRVGVQG